MFHSVEKVGKMELLKITTEVFAKTAVFLEWYSKRKK